jgi:cytochrome c oxidase subunit 2
MEVVNPSPRHSRRRARVAAGFAVVALAAAAAACAPDTNSDLSELAQEGERILRTQGCVGCHGRDGKGEGGLAPTWIGLPDSEIELDDGSTVIADDPYLRRAITDPSVEIHVGGNSVMTENDLDDDEIDAVIAFIREIQPSG